MRYLVVSSPPSASPRPNCGFSLLEVTVAAGMLAILLVSSAKMINVMSAQQRAADRQAVAVQTVQNLSEQMGSLAWNEVTAETASALELPESARTYLPGAKVTAAVTAEEQPIFAKRVSIELSWNGPAGQPARPVRMTAWVFPDEQIAQ